MKGFKTLLFILLSLALVSQAAIAADPIIKKDQKTYPIGTQLNPKTGVPYTEQELIQNQMSAKQETLRLKAAEEERARQAAAAEAERRRQEEANKCSDYSYEGSNVRPLTGGPTGYQCPPGYSCNRSGIIIECRYEDNLGQAAIIPRTSPACAYESCS